MTRAERLAMQAAALTERLCETVTDLASVLQRISAGNALAGETLRKKQTEIAAAREFLAAREETTNGD